MALPKVIRNPQVIATIRESPKLDVDLSVNWDRHPIEIEFAGSMPDVQRHEFLFDQLVLLAEDAALRLGDIRKRVPREHLKQLALRLFWILVHSDLYRPVSSRAGAAFTARRMAADLAEAERNRARPAKRRGGPAVIDLTTRQPRRTRRLRKGRPSGNRTA